MLLADKISQVARPHSLGKRAMLGVFDWRHGGLYTAKGDWWQMDSVILGWTALWKTARMGAFILLGISVVYQPGIDDGETYRFKGCRVAGCDLKPL